MGVVANRLNGVEPPVERGVYTAREAAVRLGVSYTTVKLALQRGELKAIRVGSRWAIPKAWLDRLLAGEGDA